jgi:hypothetical protein
MKIITLLLIFTVVGCTSKKTIEASDVVTVDVDNFWIAFDSIHSTNDSLLQAKYLSELYIERGTEGLKKMMSARNYSANEYLHVINNYPNFWHAIRLETAKAKATSIQLSAGIENLKKLYPYLKPAKIYFTIGALRSNGTTIDSSVLVGAELALANVNTPTTEFPEYLSHLSSYFQTDPSKNIVFLTIHEYIHTQQITTIGNSLLAQSVIEGVAEFIAEKALSIESPNPQIEYGRAHDTKIRQKFQLEMFSPFFYNWLWNSADNEFGMRDLAYYVGYAICSKFYWLADDKKQAIKEMIELNYNDEAELIQFVEKSGYFADHLLTYKNVFEAKRPVVLTAELVEKQSEFNDSIQVLLKIQFSDRMNPQTMGFDYGPLGENNAFQIQNFLGYTDSSRIAVFSVQPLTEKQNYQIIISSAFQNSKGIPLKPFLFEHTNL